MVIKRKEKIDTNKKSILKEKLSKLKKGKKEVYTSKEVITIMLFSLGLGFLICFAGVSIFSGRNYIAINKDLDKVVDTYYAIVDNYYGELDKNTLVEGAVEGMLSSIGDTYTSYSDSNAAETFNETINGSYEGIGCSVASYEDGKIVVIEVFQDSPSERAGLKVGDIITKVDGESYEGKTSTDISNYIKDSGKESVTLTVERDNLEKDIVINLSKVEIPYITGKVVEQDDKKVGYIQIALFSSTSSKQFKNKLEELEKENIDGLIIDVRGNTGGYLTSVTDISNLFLEKGKVIYRLEDQSGTVKKKDTTKEKRDYKIAVLINKGSASASEILASAIKESYSKGYVVGTNSYGKGTVQQTKKLLDGSMIKYTTQKWLTPNGNFINEVGVEPTNKIELSDEYLNNPSEDTDNQLQEAIKIIIK